MSPGFGKRKAPTRIRRKTYEKPEDKKQESDKKKSKEQKKKFGVMVNTDMQSAIQYSVEQRREYPSVVEQARKSGLGFQWVRSEFLLPGPHHYNPGLIERVDGLWMAYRDQDQFQDSRIGVCRLAGDECLPEENRKIELPDHFGRLLRVPRPVLARLEPARVLRCIVVLLDRLEEDMHSVLRREPGDFANSVQIVGHDHRLQPDVVR